ncbi:hypothetical protein Agub_g1114 [Astrephomene gubernaculifera]|uniref:protein-serine/threonine phosphatase n=1 Tax=Astrephomene gubernaculifera TaxID=47775 RepID=A0AAD3DEV5_9CHLO|nr:hypothetical protein Agub_g1114 [Astrephomene gubernaculifera]
MMDTNQQEGSQDDDLAAAFDEGFDEELQDEAPEEDVASGSVHDDEGGSPDSGSEVDLDDFADQAFAEVEALEKETGVEARPAKRQRVVKFSSTVQELGDGSSPDAPPLSPGNPFKDRTGSGRQAAPTSKAAAAPCAHPVWVFGLCGVCGLSKEALEGDQDDRYGQYLGAAPGQSQRQQRGGSGSSGGGGGGGSGGGADQGGGVRLRHLHASQEVEVSRQEAERIRRDTVSRLLSRRRLILILDLDHTLLNSVMSSEVGPEAAPRLAELQRLEEEANLGPRRLLHRLADGKLWTKLRPGVFEFLEGLRDVYEMHIYTMGDKTYAAEVRRLLDPTGRLFSSVIAKDHSTAAHAKHLDVLLSADELALVLDDTEVVWPGHRRNLLQIDRYHFFPSDLRKWRLDGTALLEQGRDESAADGAMATHMRVLKEVHARFFSTDDPTLPPLERRDVRDVLAAQRAQILQGCCITFSRCWPQDRSPRQEPLWQLASGLGAQCRSQYDPAETTHVVAAAGGTEKVHLARSQGKVVVSPNWLHACSFRWQRVPEKDFAVRELGSRGGGGEDKAQGCAGGSGSGDAVGDSKLSAEEELRVVMAVAGGGGGGG